MNVGEVLTFNYTGGMQQVTLTDKGLYRLRVWGGQGRCSNGGKGGYATGYIEVTSPLTLYVCVGQGYDGTNQINGGYNGGGTGHDWYGDGQYVGFGGGGATHIAKVNGLLKDIGYTSFVTNGNGLLVGGGGGGSTRNQRSGGTGGGTSGGQGQGDNQNPGTQTSGYAFGQGGDANTDGGGGGGGLYGGSGGGYYSDGSGGSGYIGGVPAITFKGTTYTPSTGNAAKSGQGMADITFVDKSSSIIGTLDGSPFESATFNGASVETITFNGTAIA